MGESEESGQEPNLRIQISRNGIAEQNQYDCDKHIVKTVYLITTEINERRQAGRRGISKGGTRNEIQ